MLKNHHESWYQGKLIKSVKTAMPHAVVLKLADKYLLGIPDLCIIRNNVTSWWELKVHRLARAPKLTDFGKGVQRNTAQRLSTEGICYYIIFVDTPSSKRVLIVDPFDLEIEKPEEVIEGHDYDAVADFIQWNHK